MLSILEVWLFQKLRNRHKTGQTDLAKRPRTLTPTDKRNMRPVLAGLIVVVPLLALTAHGSDRGTSSSSSHLRRPSSRTDAGFPNATSAADRSLKVKKSGDRQQAATKTKKRVVVRYKNSEGKAALLRPRQQQQQGLVGEQRTVYHDFDDDNVLVLDLDDDEIQALSLDANIAAVEKDHRYYALGNMVRELSVNETRRLAETTPYGITMVQADLVPIGPYGVKICVADTGVVHHPDLPTGMNGADRTSSNGAQIYWDGDKKSHGTHTAGTVAAVKNNGIGVRGVAAGASLYITRALDDVGYARESDIYAAIKQCADAGAQVISLSLGGGGITSSFKSLIDNLYYQNDIVIVAGTINIPGVVLTGGVTTVIMSHHASIATASGNDGKNGVKYPAAYPLVVAVGALSSDYSLWSGSNWGDQVELVAPGNLVLSTAVNGKGEFVYQQWSGTSMATPHVAGVAVREHKMSCRVAHAQFCTAVLLMYLRLGGIFQGLLRSYYPQCSNNQIRFAMAYTAKDLDDSSSDSWQGCDLRFGYGVVQAQAALNFLKRYSCASTWGRQAVLGGCGVTKKRNS
jgi:Subtilase family